MPAFHEDLISGRLLAFWRQEYDPAYINLSLYYQEASGNVGPEYSHRVSTVLYSQSVPLIREALLCYRHLWYWGSGQPCSLGFLTGKIELTHWKRLWCWEGFRAGGEGDDRGWDGWMASQTQWTWVHWVWVNSGRWWWTGRPGVLQFMGSQRVGHDWATELNWAEDGFY